MNWAEQIVVSLKLIPVGVANISTNHPQNRIEVQSTIVHL